MTQVRNEAKTFRLLETTIDDIRDAYAAGELSARQLVQLYIKRIEAYDRAGPRINSIITVNPRALEEADRLDSTLKSSGPVGSLHGIPVILKDQIDASGMPTTLGSVLFKDYYPDRDSYVVEKLKQAGAIILAKATLGELGGGDTHGSLFGSTRNPYDLDRTVGGSSGGPAASVAANLCAVAIGQEALASIRRPAAWTCVVGMRPTAGLVSRSGVYAGWPATAASLGPITRTVSDQLRLLDVLIGYDPEDPITSLGIGHAGVSFKDSLDRDGLKGARLGILRESIGSGSEPESEDFKKVTSAFDVAVQQLKAAGATIFDPLEIPKLKKLLGQRGTGGGGAGNDEAFDVYFSRSARRPFKSREEMLEAPAYSQVYSNRRSSSAPPRPAGQITYGDYLTAREELTFTITKIMADFELDAIVYKSAEHQPTLISEGVSPPYVNQKGATSLNTFLVYVPAISVPAGFTSDNLPIGITFQGRPYSDALMLKLAYGYEQSTMHRRPPETAPPMLGEP